MPVPPGTDPIVEFVDDLLATYPASLSFPQICDLILFEVFTKRKEARGWLKRIFPQSELTARVELVFRFIAMLVSINACPAYLPESLSAVGRQAAPTDTKQMRTTEPGQSATPSAAEADASLSKQAQTIQQPPIVEVRPGLSDEEKPATGAPSGETEPGASMTKHEPQQEGLDLAGNSKDSPTSKTPGPDHQN